MNTITDQINFYRDFHTKRKNKQEQKANSILTSFFITSKTSGSKNYKCKQKEEKLQLQTKYIPEQKETPKWFK